MFSKKMAMILGVALLVAVNIVILSITSREGSRPGIGGGALTLVAPLQSVVHRCIHFFVDKWEHYFMLVSAARENERLRAELARAVASNQRLQELELANQRFRDLLGFRKTLDQKVLAAEVIGKDPSPWFRNVTIDKGEKDGVTRGLPVIVPEGVVGQVTEVAAGYAKVMLIIDRTNAVDALVQRTRARGIVQGDFAVHCILKYVLRKNDVQVGDKVISSGLDGVFPKGQPIGRISEVTHGKSGIFQDLTVTPFVDFEKLESVLVVLDPPLQPFASDQ